LIKIPCPACFAAVLLFGAVGVTYYTRPPVERDPADAVLESAPLPPTGLRVSQTRPDLSGRTRTGLASFYADMFAGRTMADGTRMDPHGDNAASKTLPLGTTARVTNTETGKSADVTVQDRGPYAKGRIIDLSPATAREIGLDRQAGIAKVEVSPIEVPLPGGGVKQGAGAVASRTAANVGKPGNGGASW
jgi:rare lipoprotein A